MLVCHGLILLADLYRVYQCKNVLNLYTLWLSRAIHDIRNVQHCLQYCKSYVWRFQNSFTLWSLTVGLSSWTNLPGHRHGKRFISGPCKKRAEGLLKPSRHQLRLVVTFLTGHWSTGPLWWRSDLQILQIGDWNCVPYYLLLRGVGSSTL
jgi:hypothetical protein